MKIGTRELNDLTTKGYSVLVTSPELLKDLVDNIVREYKDNAL